MPTAEEQRNEQIVRALFADIDRNSEPDFLDAYLDDDLVCDLALPGYGSTKADYLAGFRLMRRAIPGTHEILDLIATADRVVVRVHGSGRHVGEFLGVPPAQRCIEANGMAILRLRDGRIVEHHGAVDMLAALCEARENDLEHLQAHEFVNRVHAIKGMLALGDYERVQQYVADTELQLNDSLEISEAIAQPEVAGLVLALRNLARALDVTLTVAPGTILRAVPPGLRSADLVCVVGNLVRNALEAVADVDDPARRKVDLRVAQSARRTRVTVRDRGPGFSADARTMLCPGQSGKAGHAGVGLAAVAAVARDAVTIDVCPRGWTRVIVDLPGVIDAA